MSTILEASRKGQIVAGRYRLTELVGYDATRGNAVWRAELHGAAGFAREVAVRTIVPPDAARVAAAIARSPCHPNVVQVLDVCSDGAATFHVVMEWVDGVTLGELSHGVQRLRLPMPWQLVAAIGVGALRGLAAGHGRVRADGAPAPLLHGHLGPDSVLLGRNGVVKLTPFAITPEPVGPHREDALRAGADRAYLAPELVAGWRPTIAADFYALGATLWNALVGAPPEPGDVFTSLEQLRPDAPPRLRAALGRALSRSPGERFATAEDMARELRADLAAVRWLHGAEADLGAAVAEAIDALAWGRRPRGAPSPAGSAANPILLTRRAAEPVADADLVSIELAPREDAPYAAFELYLAASLGMEPR